MNPFHHTPDRDTDVPMAILQAVMFALCLTICSAWVILAWRF